MLLRRISFCVTRAERQKNAVGAKEYRIFLKSFDISDSLVAFKYKGNLGMS